MPASNSVRLFVQGLLLSLTFMTIAGSSYAAVRFDSVVSPTEVINTGRSEVTGSISLIVRGTGNVTGTSAGGDTQIAFIYSNPALQIDNTTSTGIRLFFSAGFIPAFTGAAGTVGIVSVENRVMDGSCYGVVTISMKAGATPSEGDFIRLEGVRARVDSSSGIVLGTDLFADLQSVNDPAAQSFTPDRVRVAKSFDAMNVLIISDTISLCYPTLGKPVESPNYSITITEGYARAFVDADAGNDGDLSNDRVDSGGQTQVFVANPDGGAPVPGTRSALGAPTNSTQFLIWFESIPSSVSGIEWPEFSSESAAGSQLELVGSPIFSASAGIASAVYSFETPDQVNLSDIIVESFTIIPLVILKTGQSATGRIVAGVSLAPVTTEVVVCRAPGEVIPKPRFILMYEADAIAANNPPGDSLKVYATVISDCIGQKAEITDPAPGSTLTSTTVTFTWNSGTNVSQYWLSVGTYPGGVDIYNKSTGTVLSAEVSGLPRDGSTVDVRLWSYIPTTWQYNDYIYTSWSSVGKATLVSPTGIVPSNTPTYIWNAVSNSTWYQLWVTDSAANPKIQAWYTSAQAGCPSGTGWCSISPATALANGAAIWWIQTWNSSGYGPWSDGMSFTFSPVPPVKATLLAPSGNIATNLPTYSWKALSNSTWYQLWVTDSAANPKIQAWYTAAQAACASGTGTCSITPATALADGAATWWIQTWNSFGYGPWSDGMSFTVSPGGPPGKATLVAPSGNVATATPAYVWNAVSNSTWYQLWVTDSAANPKFTAWYTAAQCGCASGTGTCTITPATAVANGSATWWILTWNSSGYGPWSDPLTFNVTGGGIWEATIDIIPPTPVADDSVYIKISGNWPDSCTPRDPVATITGNRIYVQSSSFGEVCLYVIGYYSMQVSVGKLAAGIYEVVATNRAGTNSPTELGRKTFSVTVGTALSVPHPLSGNENGFCGGFS